MTGMVQVALAEDATEAEELQELLAEAGIEAAVELDHGTGSLKLLVPETSLEAALDAIEPPTASDG